NVAWVTAERIHLPKDLDVSQGPSLLRIRFLKPIEGLVLVAKRGIIICNKAGIDIAPLLQLLAKLNGAAHSYENWFQSRRMLPKPAHSKGRRRGPRIW